MRLDAKIPGGPLEKKWDKHRFELKLVNPPIKENLISSLWVPALPEAPQPRHLPNLAIM